MQLGACVGVTWPSLHHPVGLGLKKPVQEMLIFSLLLLLRVIKTFVSDSGVSYLLPISMKLGQTNLLAGK